MSTGEIAALTAIVFVYLVFSATLFGVTWYCGRDTPGRGAPPVRSTGARPVARGP